MSILIVQIYFLKLYCRYFLFVFSFHVQSGYIFSSALVTVHSLTVRSRNGFCKLNRLRRCAKSNSYSAFLAVNYAVNAPFTCEQLPMLALYQAHALSSYTQKFMQNSMLRISNSSHKFPIRTACSPSAAG